MKDAWVFFFATGLLMMMIGNIWLVLIIMRESPFAALLCLVVPFLSLFFIQEHWNEAKPAVFTWIGGLATLILGAIVSI